MTLPASSPRCGLPACAALLALLVLALFVTTAAGAQAPVQDLFVDSIDVDVVNVEVVVLDRQGNRVPGLTIEDFELYEDGRRVEISNFYASARPDRVLSSFERDRAMLAGEPIELPPVPEDQVLHLLVYVDHFNLTPAESDRGPRPAPTLPRRSHLPGRGSGDVDGL